MCCEYDCLHHLGHSDCKQITTSALILLPRDASHEFGVWYQRDFLSLRGHASFMELRLQCFMFVQVFYLRVALLADKLFPTPSCASFAARFSDS